MVWRCPSCGEALEASDDGLLCAANHSFDRAKEGYVNLLPVQKKRSKRPGDSLEMVLGRRVVHDARLYQPLAEALGDVVSARPGIRTLLDIGCGEGFYGGVLSSQLPHLTCYGIDVAKPAVKLAAKTYPHQHYAVASSRDLPVITSSIDMALCVFSPSNDAEISRVLRPGGYAYIAEPLFRGSFNECLRLFHDEEYVRREAFGAITASVASGLMESVAQEFFLSPCQIHGCLYNHPTKKVTRITSPDRSDSFTAKPEQLSCLRLRWNFQFYSPIQRRHLKFSANSRIPEANRDFAVQIFAVSLKDMVGLHVHFNIQVP